MPRQPRVGWIDGDDVAELMDVSAIACSICGGAARVPEDVLGIVPTHDHSDQHAVVVCDSCSQTMTMEQMAQLLARMVYELRERQQRDFYVTRGDDDD